jgi:hypothetical protein
MEPPKYTPAEQAIIDLLRKDWRRPMTQGEIDFQLEMAKSNSRPRPDWLIPARRANIAN